MLLPYLKICFIAQRPTNYHYILDTNTHVSDGDGASSGVGGDSG